MTPTTTVTDDSLRRSIAWSAGTHGVLLIMLYVGLPTLFKPLPDPHPPVPLEIVDVAEITNTRTKDPEETVQKAEPPPKPAPKPVEQFTPPTPEPPQPKPQPTKSPDEAKLDDVLLPKKKPDPKPKTDEQQQPQANPLASVLKNVEKLKKAEEAKPTPIKSETTAKAQEAKSNAPSLSDRLTISEEDLLRRQIQQCWNMPIGARDAENLVVEVIINVNPDRTVQSADIVDKGRLGSDPFYRAAAESAIRALKHPRCTPLELPPDKYEQWKVIHFNFDPRDML